MSKLFKDLTIKDAFMFAAVMVNPDKCGPFLKLVQTGSLSMVFRVRSRTHLFFL